MLRETGSTTFCAPAATKKNASARCRPRGGLLSEAPSMLADSSSSTDTSGGSASSTCRTSKKASACVALSWLQQMGESWAQVAINILQEERVRRRRHLNEDVMSQCLTNRLPFVVLDCLSMNGTRLRRCVFSARSTRLDRRIERRLIGFIVQYECWVTCRADRVEKLY